MNPQRADIEASGRHYGSLAFASVVLSCYAGYFFYSPRFFTSEAMVPVTFGLGALYMALGVLDDLWVDVRTARGRAAYYLVQCAVLTLLVVLSPVRGFFGIIVLPLVSQAIFDLRAGLAALITVYLFALNILIWWVPFGWNSGLQAIVSYTAGFAFTVVFSIITRQAMNARLRENALRREVEAVNDLLRAQAAQAEDLATTRERNRVAREIHDGLGHYLTVVKTQLDAAAVLIDTQPAAARDAVTKAARLTGDALDDVRRSVGTLRRDEPRMSLVELLRALAAESGLPVRLELRGEPRPLSPGVEHALFRSAQEGLTNIRKHADAAPGSVTLDFRAPDRVTLEVVDEGRGLPAAAAAGFGLRGIAERIALLGGRVASGPRAGAGFALTVELPA